MATHVVCLENTPHWFVAWAEGCQMGVGFFSAALKHKATSKFAFSLTTAVWLREHCKIGACNLANIFMTWMVKLPSKRSRYPQFTN